MVKDAGWATGRYPGVVEWIVATHRAGPVVRDVHRRLPLAETGGVSLRLEETLIGSGDRQDLVTTGGAGRATNAHVDVTR